MLITGQKHVDVAVVLKWPQLVATGCPLGRIITAASVQWTWFKSYTKAPWSQLRDFKMMVVKGITCLVLLLGLHLEESIKNLWHSNVIVSMGLRPMQLNHDAVFRQNTKSSAFTGSMRKKLSPSFPRALPLCVLLLSERMCPLSGETQSRDLLNDNLSLSSHFSTRLIYLIKCDAFPFVALIGA